MENVGARAVSARGSGRGSSALERALAERDDTVLGSFWTFPFGVGRLRG